VTDPEHVQRLVEQAQERENVKERLEREHEELLHELRSVIPGAQVLFGFLLAIRFTNQFEGLDDTQRDVYYFALLATAAALVCFMSPAAYHRLRFRTGDKEYMMRKGNREAIAGTVAIALAFTSVVFLVTDLVFGTGQAVLAALALFAFIAWRWWALAVYRAWQDGREARDFDR
jgi:predicted membrane channel-forming protein YqfA (hemolysin III family)